MEKVILHQISRHMKKLTRLVVGCALLSMACLAGQAQEPWTADQCIQYAVRHNHDVRLQHFALDDCQTEKERAAGAFLPAAEGNVGGQYNFGRAIDPETNTYTHVSTFYNSYSLNVGIPLFDGFQRFNNLRAAKADMLMGRSRLAAQKDAVAQKVLETYMNALYYKGCIEIAAQKRTESEMLLRQTRVMAEVGRKGEADVAQMQAIYAADDYEVTRQQGLFDKAMLALKQLMNFPRGDTLNIATYRDVPPDIPDADAATIYAQAKSSDPGIEQAAYSLQSARYAFRASRGALFPSISLGAGISTTYYQQLNVPHTNAFGTQFRNNAGQYVYLSLSIPVFNRLQTIAHIRRQRNNVRRAEEELEYRHNELQRLIQETLTDLEQGCKETEKMRAKVASDSIAARLTVRRYEEGLASSIDVQTQAVALLQSKAQLWQCRLIQCYRTRLLNHYKGKSLWTE